MKLANQILKEISEGLGLDVKTKGSKIVFKNSSDQEKAKKKLAASGMKGLDKQKGKELEFANPETMEQALEIVEVKK